MTTSSRSATLGVTVVVVVAFSIAGVSVGVGIGVTAADSSHATSLDSTAHEISYEKAAPRASKSADTWYMMDTAGTHEISDIRTTDGSQSLHLSGVSGASVAATGVNTSGSDVFLDEFEHESFADYTATEGELTDWNFEQQIDDTSLYGGRDEGETELSLDPDHHSWSGNRSISVDFQVDTSNWKRNAFLEFGDGEDRWRVFVAVQGDSIALGYDEGDNGTRTRVAKKNVPVSDHDVHTLNVTIEEAQITIRLDGDVKIEHTHTEPIEGGSVGLGTSGGIPHATWFDNLRVVDRSADNNPPSASIDWDPQEPRAGESVIFDGGLSSDSDGSITSYEWDIDDDGTFEETGSFLNHTFETAGNKSVTLRVTDDDGATDTETVTIPVFQSNDPPSASGGWSPIEPITGEPVTLDGSPSSDPDGSIVGYEWDVDDDGTFEKQGEFVNHTFETAGNKSVTLRVTDDDGATDTETITVPVFQSNDPPVASFNWSPDDPVDGEPVTFDAATSFDSDGSVVSHEWDLDDDGSFEMQGDFVNYTFETAGNKSVTLRVTDDDGATDTETITVPVYQSNDQSDGTVSFDTDLDGQISILELQSGIGAHDNDDTINGQSVGYRDVLANTRAFNAGTSVPGPVADGAEVSATATRSAQAAPGKRFSVVYELENFGTEDANAGGLLISTPQGITVESMSGDGSHAPGQGTAFLTSGLAVGASATVNVTFAVASNATERNDTVTATATAGTEMNVSTDVSIRSEDDGTDSGTSAVNATRDIANQTLAPGASTLVTVTIEGTVAGIDTTFSPSLASASIVDSDGFPITSADASGVSVLWESASDPTLVYEVAVPSDAVDNDTFFINGTVTDGDGNEAVIKGDTTIRVKTSDSGDSVVSFTESGAITIAELLDGIATHQNGGTIDGQSVGYRDVLANIRAFNAGTSVPGPVSDGAEVSASATDSVQVTPGERFSVVYDLRNGGTEDANAAGLSIGTPRGITVESMSGDGTHAPDRGTAFLTSGLDAGTGATINVTFAVASNATERNGTVTATVTAGTETNVSTDVTIGSGDDGTDDGMASITATRDIADQTLAPGETTRVTVNVSGGGGAALTISERFAPGFEGSQLVDSAGALIASGTPDDLIITWQSVSEQTVVYEVTVPGNASDGGVFNISGTVDSDNANKDLPISGDSTIQVRTGDTDDTTGASFANRTLSSAQVTPGGEITVTLSGEARGSSFTFNETFGSLVDNATFKSASVNGIQVQPILGTANQNGLVVTLGGLSTGDSVEATYTLSVSTNARPGDSIRIDGAVTSGSESDVALVSDTLSVGQGSPLNPPVGKYDTDADGEITITELGGAASAYARGEISITELGAVASTYAQE